MQRLTFLMTVFSLLIFCRSAHAQDSEGFQSPSKNIACLVFADGKQSSMRCDIAVMDTKPKRPADCDLEYGQAFMMNTKGRAERICYGDTLTDKPPPVLPYGEVWQRGGFTCKAEQTGVTCFNADRHGFMLARGKQEIF